MDEDYIQESGSYCEETDSDKISGLTKKGDGEQESEMATTSQVVIPEAPKRKTIVYESEVQRNIDQPLDYHVQRNKTLNMKNAAQKSPLNRRLDIQREDNQRSNQRTNQRPDVHLHTGETPNKIWTFLLEKLALTTKRNSDQRNVSHFSNKEVQGQRFARPIRDFTHKYRYQSRLQVPQRSPAYRENFRAKG